MISPIDLKRIRAETPGCEAVLHFNNAGASLPPQPVYQAVTDHLKLESRIGGYEAEAHAQEKLQRFYQAFARLLNCDPVEIAFIENATRAWDMVFYAIPFKPGDRILTARAEYASNYLAFLHVAKQKDLKIDVVPNDASGQISIDALEEMIDEDVKLIAITHVPTQGGLINPAEAVGQIARRHNILYLLDACQSVGQMPIDVRKIKCDMLSGTGRKYLRGPRGTGFLFIRRPLIELLEPPFIDLHAATWIDKDQFKIRNDARRFENWESYIAGRIGLATAVDYALEIGLEAIQERVQYLAALLRNRLSEFAGVVVRDLGRHRCGIVTFTKENESASALKQRLASHQINISVSPARYARLDLDSRGISELARASVHYFNTEAEIDRFCTKLSQ
ncbi:MAG: aminotransferase class V-fold PLP-dependent enzyme [Desulfobacterales bacterium]|jgi:selenocysteine lyase/cysteine desulfurase|nr:aminotransferase class V-fold PLP-dependent enzyme [Desulfobacterales bacterium]MDH4009431.1 aminotransferase class V-fold PLP-dependent enzyme [Desulfobacterales bacterium]